jgi:hypothetical protein
MLLETALSVGYCSLFLWFIGKHRFFRTDKISNKKFQLLFIIKLAAGLLLYFIYTRYYTDRKYADIFRYYDDSGIVFNSLFSKPYDFFRMVSGFHSSAAELWQYYNPMHNWFNSEMIFNDARTMIRLNVLMRFISAGTFYPHMIFFCFMGFAGLCAIYKVAVSELKSRQHLLMFGVFLLPGVLLWTSGVIKEAFLVFSIGLMIYFSRKIILKEGNRMTNVFLSLFFMFCLLNIKSYVLFAILPGYLTYLYLLLKPGKPIIRFFAVHLVYFFLLFNFSSIFTHHPVPVLLQNKQNEFLSLVQAEHPGSVITIPLLDGTLKSLIKNIPTAFINTLTRPFIFESVNIVMMLAAIENLIILILLLLNLILYIKSPFNDEGLSFILLCKYFIVIMFCLIGWVTPILGAVVRYKVAALPFLGILIFSNARWKSADTIINKYI